MKWMLGAMLAGCAAGAAAQRRPLTLDDLYDPSRRVNFSGPPLPALYWIDAQRYATSRTTPDGPEWQAVDAASGRMGARVLLPVLVPERVKVRAVVPLTDAAAALRGLGLDHYPPSPPPETREGQES